MRLAVIVAALSLQMLTGCATDPKDFARVPHMTPVGTGLVDRRPVAVEEGAPSAKDTIRGSGPAASDITTASLWRDGSADLFKDPRARHVGDTLTVKIFIRDRATIDSQSDRSRVSSRDSVAEFAYDIATKSIATAGTGNMSGGANANSTHKGEGATSRAETIELLIAGVVVDRLPNGNLLIQGSQEVRVNFEVRELTVAGIVRPRDIGSDNTISYDKIAEARISYGGRGRIMEVQQPRWGQQLLDLISPF